MRILVIGGTRFLGRHFVAQALAAGHTLTLLHRGRSNAALFPEAEHLIGDRNADLAPLLAGRAWDAVLDTSAYVPRQVHSLAAALQGRVPHYLLVSSISVYARFPADGPDEDAPLQQLADPATETITGETYGGLKVLCEQALHQALPGQGLVARPGLIVGPWDPTGRFTWWMQRLARGGTVLAPGDPTEPVQVIDARDAAAWLLLQTERGTRGTYNLTGPTEPLDFGGFLHTTAQTLRPDAVLQWLPEDFLVAQGVAPWSDLPVWVPASEAGLHRTRTARAQATGLRCRPLADTVADTAAWATAHDGAHAGVGLSPEREAALLQAWAARHRGDALRP